MATTAVVNTPKNSRKPAAAPEPEPEIAEEEAPPAGPTAMRLMHRVQGRIVGMLDRAYGEDEESKRRIVRAVAALLGDSSMPTT